MNLFTPNGTLGNRVCTLLLTVSTNLSYAGKSYQGFRLLYGLAGNRDGGGQFDFLSGRTGKKKRASSASDGQVYPRYINKN